MRKHSPEIDLQALEWSTSNTAATFTCYVESAVMRYTLSLATNTRRAAVEKWARLRALGPASPMPVRLRPIVVTFFSQRMFICSGEVTVPREKVCSAVNMQRLFHVNDDEIVKTGPGAWVLVAVILGRSVDKALHCSNVCEFVANRKVTPWYYVSLVK